MGKNNEANALTKECILTALLRLMESEPYDKISITDITNLAGVSRMAYYRNYESKEDILLKHLEEAEKELLKEIGADNADSVRDVLIYASNYIQENAAVIRAIYRANLGHLLSNMLSQRIFSYFPVAHTSTEGRYAVPFFVGAILSVFQMWFHNGMNESCEEIADIITRLINRDNALEYVVRPKE